MPSTTFNSMHRVTKVATFTLVSILSHNTFAHGLIESPASRNQFCGVLTKPDEADRGAGQYPEICAEAFSRDFTGGYSFMSVLTHAEGRKKVTPLPTNVCGFDSETWQGGPTPWDQSIDWPTNSMEPGINEIVWNISWGPHFDDTKEFVYYITKPDFVYEIGKQLTWDDFEATPFCDLEYDDRNPSANPDITADKGATRFTTVCNVPERSGRHIIYGEWGRNQFTYERFHGCIDADFTGGTMPAIDAKITASLDGNSILGAGNFTLDATSSTGENLTYQWSIDANNASLYTLNTPTAATSTLSFGDPTSALDVTVNLSVSNGEITDTASFTFEHLPASTPATWKLANALTLEEKTLNVGDIVSIRVVDNGGNDSYIPAAPLIINANNNAANLWPVALAQKINALNGDIMIGVLDENGSLSPVQDATANNIYTRVGTEIAGTYLNIASTDSSRCQFIVNNEWNNGYNANIRITNTGDTAISGWEVSWTLQTSTVANLWNAEFTPGTPNIAKNLSWNATIQPGESVEFGFNGNKNTANEPAEVPLVFGSVCSN